MGNDKSTAFGLALAALRQIDGCDDIMLDSNWTRSGLMGHLATSNGCCLLAYEEIDAFFAGIIKGEKLNVSERTFFCELYDGRPQKIVRATNDGKPVKISIGNISMNICGFHQPEPFLKDYYDLQLRRDGFMERFLICCPLAKRPTQETIDQARHQLTEDYPSTMHNLEHLYQQIYFNFHRGVVLELHPDAITEYVNIAAEETEEFNAAMDSKIEYAQSAEVHQAPNPTLETKYSRSVIKLAGLLHILEIGFQSCSATANIDGQKSIIGKTSFRRATCLAKYLAHQREVLFAKAEESVDATAEMDLTMKIHQRVLMAKGKFSVARLVSKGFTPANRPTTEEVRVAFTELSDKGLGKIRKEGITEAFLKAPSPTAEQLEPYRVTGDQYQQQLREINRQISLSQRERFTNWHQEQYTSN